MKCINVTVQINGNRISFETVSEDLYDIGFKNVRVKKLDSISEIHVTQNLVILRCEDRDFRDGSMSAKWQKDNREENNIDAYDLSGEHLWNIGEIVGDIKLAFDNSSIRLRDDLVKEGLLKDNTQCSEDLLVCNACGFLYIIDPTEKKVVNIINGKW